MKDSKLVGVKSGDLYKHKDLISRTCLNLYFIKRIMEGDQRIDTTNAQFNKFDILSLIWTLNHDCLSDHTWLLQNFSSFGCGQLKFFDYSKNLYYEKY